MGNSPRTPAHAPILRIVLVGLSSLAVAMGIGRFAFTPLLPLMQKDGLVSIADGGLLASIHFLGYWLGAVFAAKLPFSPRLTLQASLIVIGVSTLGMGLTDNMVIWSFLRWISGVCSALALVLVSSSYLKYLAEAGRPELQGWVFSGVGAGITLAGLGTLAIMFYQIGSSHSWLIFGAISLLVVTVICVSIGPEIDHARPGAAQQKSQPSPLIWSIIIPYGALGVGYIIPATYLPVMARDIIPSPLLFGWAWPVFGAAAFLSTLLAARLQRYYSSRLIWVASQLVMAFGLLLPAVYPHLSTIIIAGVCVGGTFMIITMMGMKEAYRIVPTHDIMRHLAVMTASFATGQIIGPLFASLIYDVTESFSLALVISSIILAATALTLLRGAGGRASHTV